MQRVQILCKKPYNMFNYACLSFRISFVCAKCQFDPFLEHYSYSHTIWFSRLLFLSFAVCSPACYCFRHQPAQFRPAVICLISGLICNVVFVIIAEKGIHRLLIIRLIIIIYLTFPTNYDIEYIYDMN